MTKITPIIPNKRESKRDIVIFSRRINIEKIKAKSGAVIVKVVNSGKDTNFKDKKTKKGVGRKISPRIIGIK